MRRQPLVSEQENEQLVGTLERVSSETGFAVRGARDTTRRNGYLELQGSVNVW